MDWDRIIDELLRMQSECNDDNYELYVKSFNDTIGKHSELFHTYLEMLQKRWNENENELFKSLYFVIRAVSIGLIRTCLPYARVLMNCLVMAKESKQEVVAHAASEAIFDLLGVDAIPTGEENENVLKMLHEMEGLELESSLMLDRKVNGERELMLKGFEDGVLKEEDGVLALLAGVHEKVENDKWMDFEQYKTEMENAMEVARKEPFRYVLRSSEILPLEYLQNEKAMDGYFRQPWIHWGTRKIVLDALKVYRDIFTIQFCGVVSRKCTIGYAAYLEKQHVTDLSSYFVMCENALMLYSLLRLYDANQCLKHVRGKMHQICQLMNDMQNETEEALQCWQLFVEHLPWIYIMMAYCILDEKDDTNEVVQAVSWFYTYDTVKHTASTTRIEQFFEKMHKIVLTKCLDQQVKDMIRSELIAIPDIAFLSMICWVIGFQKKQYSFVVQDIVSLIEYQFRRIKPPQAMSLFRIQASILGQMFCCIEAFLLCKMGNQIVKISDTEKNANIRVLLEWMKKLIHTIRPVNESLCTNFLTNAKSCIDALFARI